jgi:hypothetical protein
MAIIAHLQKASLLVTARKLADLTPYKNDGALSPLDPESFDQIKRHFMAFTQTYWFEEITPQEQGIELYDMFKTSPALASPLRSQPAGDPGHR